MPEGDTIFRAARTLHRALAGEEVSRFQTGYAHLARVDDDTPLRGRTVERVESRGKHLLMHFSGGLVLHTHMRMSGSWHIYRPGERWREPAAEARIVIETPRFVAVGFRVPVAELLDPRELERHEHLRSLGPDLLGESVDRGEVLRRMRAQGDRAIGEVLLDQRVAAGVGNVIKSETLFAAQIHPKKPVSAIDDAGLDRLVTVAQKFLRINVSETLDGMRRTTGRMEPSARLWVYGRAGEPCRKCEARIERFAEGEGARLTYWCPRCQPELA